MEKLKLNDNNFLKIGKIFDIFGIIYLIYSLYDNIFELYKMITFFITHGTVSFEAFFDMYHYSVGNLLYNNLFDLVSIVTCIFFLIYLFKEFGTGKIRFLKLFLLFLILLNVVSFITLIINRFYLEWSFIRYSLFFITFIVLGILIFIFLSNAEKYKKALKITAIIFMIFNIANYIYDVLNQYVFYTDIMQYELENFLLSTVISKILSLFSLTPFLFMALYPVNYVYGSGADNEIEKSQTTENIL